MELETAWRGLKNDLPAQGMYLTAIPTEQLPKLLKATLAPTLLDAMLRACLYRCIIDDSHAWCTEFVTALASTPRFGLSLMGIGKGAKVELRRLWAAAQSGDNGHGGMGGVRGKYGL